MTTATPVHPQQGIALRLPERPYTVDLQYCLAPILYSPDTGMVAMAHVYDPSGPGRYSAVNVIESLIEDIIAQDSSINLRSLRAHLVGELDDSLALPGSRTKKVMGALQKRKIGIGHKVVGGHYWKRVSILDRPEMLVEEYLEDYMQRYGEFHAEREYRLRL